MQKDRLIYCVYGWGAGQECWLIEWAEIFGDPAKDAVWKQLDEQLLAKQYVHESKRLLRVERVCVDSGGKKGHPDRAYRYCAARLERGVFAVKGGQKKGIPLVGLPSTHNVYRTPLFVLCTDTGKHALMKRLLLPRGKSGEANPGYIHFYDMPDELRDEFASQMASERAVYGPTGRTWEEVYANHAWDCTVYALSGLYIWNREPDAKLAALAERLNQPITEAEKIPAPAPKLPSQFSARRPGRRWSGWKS